MDTIQDLVDDGRDVRTFRQQPNQGKGAALRRGFDEATGDLLTILDADLEYDPADFVDLLQPILHEDARVVYGTRSFGSNAAYSFWYVIGNKLVAFWASLRLQRLAVRRRDLPQGGPHRAVAGGRARAPRASASRPR